MHVTINWRTVGATVLRCLTRGLPDPKFWHGPARARYRHTGFKASWSSFWLAKMGAVVTGFALPPATLSKAYALIDIRNRVESRFGDVRDDRAFDDGLRARKTEIVFHLAQATVRGAYAEPVATFDVNVMATVRVMEVILRSSSLRTVVVVTSNKCKADDGEPRQRGYV